MNTDIIEGNWEQVKGSVQEYWGKLTGSHLDQINGSRKKLAGVLQENYGIASEEAENQIKEWDRVRKNAAKSFY